MNLDFSFAPEFDALYQSFLEDPERQKFLSLDGISPGKLDIGLMSRNYFTKRLADSSVDMNANANEEMSANNYQAEVTKGILKIEGYYLLWHYAEKRFGLERANALMSAVWDGRIYFHDASGHGIQVPYCFAFSTMNLLLDGRPYGQLHSLPPKRADSFIAQAVELTMDLSQEFAGAVAPSDLIANYSWFAKREGLSDSRILNDLQKFVHVTNNKFRVAGQSPFTNISLFDRPNLEKIFGDVLFPDGTSPDLDYIMHIQKLFGAWFAKGDPVSGLPYRFPVVTCNLSVDSRRQVLDEDFLAWISEHNIEKGVFNVYINEGNKIASCCRYSSDFEQMRFRADSFGNGGLNIGSHRVVTINLPRLALDARGDRDKFLDLLEERLEMVRDLLLVHREEILGRRIKAGFLKFFEPLKWFSTDMLFSTIGIIGVYEMCHFLGIPMETEEGQEFAADVLFAIESHAQIFSKDTGYSFNVEEIPGESAAVVLAQKDRLVHRHPEPEFELYSNQYLPLIANVDAIERVKLTGRFMKYLSGGGIMHLNIQEQIKNPAVMEKLIRLAIMAGVEHLAINYGFGECVNGHTSVCGNSKTCPVCGGPIRDYLTRIIGYFTKISSWNAVRRNFEYPRRVFR